MEEEVKNTKKEEKKKNKKAVNKGKVATKLIALIAVIMMLFSVCGTLLFYLLQR